MFGKCLEPHESAPCGLIARGKDGFRTIATMHCQESFGKSLQGPVRDEEAHVLAITSDQASYMFASANFLSYELGLRIVWFPDVNHVEANIDSGVFVASGLNQVNEKARFLARLPYGPARDSGHWHGQMKTASRAFADKLREGNPVVKEFFDIYLPRICVDLGFSNPEQPHTAEAVRPGRPTRTLF